MLLNSKVTLFLTFLLSMYCLTGHDIRVIGFKKEHDGVFLVLDIITIVLFTLDIFLNSFAV